MAEYSTGTPAPFPDGLVDEAAAYFQGLQNRICSGLEELDGRRFHEDLWKYDSGQGGGRTRVLEKGGVFEKAGVNFSDVHGEFPEDFAKTMPGDGTSFRATGVSLVLHPWNPKVPTVHANFRCIVRPGAGLRSCRCRQVLTGHGTSRAVRHCLSCRGLGPRRRRPDVVRCWQAPKAPIEPRRCVTDSREHLFHPLDELSLAYLRGVHCGPTPYRRAGHHRDRCLGELRHPDGNAEGFCNTNKPKQVAEFILNSNGEFFAVDDK